MKVLLANPSYKTSLGEKFERYFIRSGSRWPHSGVKRKGTLPHYLPFPFYLAYAAAWLQRDGAEVSVLDCVALDMDEGEFLAAIKKEKPALLFFEATTPTIEYDLRLVQKIKELDKNILIALGGSHTSVFARDILAKHSAVDCILRNEYEETLHNLVRCMQNDGDWSTVKGISFRKDGAAIETEDAPLIDLTALPAPARELFPAPWKPDPALYWDGFCQKRPALQMHASRGCPYRCSFCLWNQVMFRNGKYRTFDAQRIVDEMEDLVRKYGAKEIYFDDDDFTVNQKQVYAICAETRARKLNVSWSCMGDAINLTEDLVKAMAESGCIGIKFGVESGSKRVLPSVGKPLDLKRVQDVAAWCSKYRIKTHATFSLGLYGDDMESIAETLSFMQKLDSDTMQVSICTPFPGTRFFDAVKKEGFLKTEEWEKYDGKASDVVAYPALDLEMTEKMRQVALRKWMLHKFSSPRWLFRQACYFSRMAKGMGLPFLFRQAYSILVDELLIARGRK